LFPHAPSQVTRLVWRSDQECVLRNSGNFSLTINLLIKSVN
jgi:hypothetical protein